MIKNGKYLISHKILRIIDRWSTKSRDLVRLISLRQYDPEIDTRVALMVQIRLCLTRYRRLCRASRPTLGRNNDTTSNPGAECVAEGSASAYRRSRNGADLLPPLRGDYRERSEQCKILAEIIILATDALEQTMRGFDDE